MHNLYANFVIILEVCKHFAQDLVNDKGNITRPGVVPKFSDLEVIALISAEIQLNLFETAHINLEVHYRSNQKDWKPFHKPFAKARKRIETIFSQFDDQFNIMRNYAKDYIGLFTRIISKVSALTVSQYLNKINNMPIDKIKYALA